MPATRIGFWGMGHAVSPNAYVEAMVGALLGRTSASARAATLT